MTPRIMGDGSSSDHGLQPRGLDPGDRADLILVGGVARNADLAERSASSREPKPMPSAPQAFPNAMSKRRMPDLSSRLSATRCPPASSTATVSGAQFVSRPF